MAFLRRQQPIGLLVREVSMRNLVLLKSYRKSQPDKLSRTKASKLVESLEARQTAAKSAEIRKKQLPDDQLEAILRIADA